MTLERFQSSLGGMYMMIGGDGQEYGPVTEEKIIEWIEEGRANGFTKVRPEDESTWYAINGLPEFRDILERCCQNTLNVEEIEATLPAPLGFDSETEFSPSSFNPMHCLLGGWNLLSGNVAILFTASLLYWILRTTAQIIPLIGGILGLAVSGALYAGLCMVFLRRLRGQESGLSDLFSGFSILYLPLTIAFILTRLFSWIGLFCFFLPGVYLWIAWIYAIPLILDRDYDFWQAMKFSLKRVTQVWFRVFAVYATAMSPLIIYMTYAYVQMFQMANELFQQGSLANPFKIMETIQNNPELLDKISSLAAGQQLLTVLVTPFAVAALMQGYEMLFPSHEE